MSRLDSIRQIIKCLPDRAPRDNPSVPGVDNLSLYSWWHPDLTSSNKVARRMTSPPTTQRHTTTHQKQMWIFWMRSPPVRSIVLESFHLSLCRHRSHSLSLVIVQSQLFCRWAMNSRAHFERQDHDERSSYLQGKTFLLRCHEAFQSAELFGTFHHWLGGKCLSCHFPYTLWWSSLDLISLPHLVGR